MGGEYKTGGGTEQETIVRIRFCVEHQNDPKQKGGKNNFKMGDRSTGTEIINWEEKDLALLSRNVVGRCYSHLLFKLLGETVLR